MARPTEGARFRPQKEFHSHSLEFLFPSPLGSSADTHLHRAGRLFQQNLCDVFCRVDYLRLKSQEHRQRELRAENKASLIDHVRGERLPSNIEDDVGRQILLPASHTGSPLDLHQRSLNAMAMVAVVGKRDLFITFTPLARDSIRTGTPRHSQRQAGHPRPCLAQVPQAVPPRLRTLRLRSRGRFFLRQ